jgi:hypothetical protein
MSWKGSKEEEKQINKQKNRMKEYEKEDDENPVKGKAEERQK